MSRLPNHWFIGDSHEDKTLLSRHEAKQEFVDIVLKADPNSEQGRSQWFWIRLANGDLILGCYPQDETYMAVEADSCCL